MSQDKQDRLAWLRHVPCKPRPCYLMSLALVAAAVLDPVLINTLEVKDFGVAGGGTGNQSFMPLSHQPLAGLGGHVSGHMLLRPALGQGVKPLVQTGAHSLMRLYKRHYSIHFL